MFLVGYHRNPNYHEKTTKWTGDFLREEVAEECWLNRFSKLIRSYAKPALIFNWFSARADRVVGDEHASP